MSKLMKSLPAAIMLIGCLGCLRSPNTPHQYDVLQQLREEKYLFPVRYEGDLPITFTSFEVAVVGPTSSTLGVEGIMLVKGDPDALRSTVEKRVKSKHPDLVDGRPLRIFIQFEYRDAKGEDCGSEWVKYTLSGPHPGRIQLRDIGKTGSPRSITATPEVVVWSSGAAEVEVPLN